jgi:hypothetical protein
MDIAEVHFGTHTCIEDILDKLRRIRDTADR